MTARFHGVEVDQNTLLGMVVRMGAAHLESRMPPHCLAEK
jgi:hypothetical protein